MDHDELFEQWRLAERAAVDAELAASSMGQGASDPRAAELHGRARELRERADGLLAEILLKTGAAGAAPTPAPRQPPRTSWVDSDKPDT